MIVIKPYKIIEQNETPPSSGAYAILESSSLLIEDSTPLWVANTNYSVGTEVFVSSTHRVYKCSAAGSDAISPESNPAKWTDMRPTNKWAAFDWYQNTKSSSNSDLFFEFNTGEYFANSVSVFGIICNFVKIEVFDETNAIVYSSIKQAIREASSWYDYYFGIQSYKRNIIDNKIPIGVNYSIRVTLIGAGSSIRSVGMICIGQYISLVDNIGGIEWGATITPTTLNTREIKYDGTIKIIQRGVYELMSCQSQSKINQADISTEILRDVIGIPCVWIASNGYEFANSLSIFGIAKSTPISYNQGQSIVKYEIEGIA